VAFYQRVRSGYLELIGQDLQRWAVVDGSQPVAAVQAEISRVVLPRVQAKFARAA
jgi:thymidylate kinase